MVSMILRRKEAPEKAGQRRKLPPALRSRTRDPMSFRWHFVISDGFDVSESGYRLHCTGIRKGTGVALFWSRKGEEKASARSHERVEAEES